MTDAAAADEPVDLSRRGWAVAALVVITGVTAFGVLAHIYLGSLTRFVADSYCHAALATRLGVVGMITDLYQRWSGRVSASLVEGIMGGVIGPWIAPWWSPFLLLTWLAALALLVQAFSQGVAARYRAWVAGLLALVILFVTLDNTPLASQSVYWTTGLNNYGLPLILLTLAAVGLARRAARPLHGWAGWAGLLFSFALSAFIGGFSETIVVVQGAALVLAMGLIWLFGSADLKRNLLPLLGAALLGAGVALVVVGLAPGNKVRQAFSPPPPDLVTLILYVLTYTKQVVLSVAAREPLNVIALPAVAALVGAHLARPDGWLLGSARTVTRTVLWAPVITLALVAVAILPAAYATSNVPNERNLLIVMYIMTLGLTVWGYAVGQFYRQTRVGDLQTPVERLGLMLALGVVLALFAVNTLRTGQVTLNQRSVYVAYAQGSDRNAALILAAQQAGQTAVVLEQLSNPFGLEEPQPDPQHWVSSCYSDYYGLTISTQAPAQ